MNAIINGQSLLPSVKATTVPYDNTSSSLLGENVQEVIDELNQLLTKHSTNTNNPHNITKAQIGLGNVDNTADSAKHVAYATSAGSATSATRSNTSAMADNANGVTVIKTDWSGRYATNEAQLYSIHLNDDRVWLGCSINSAAKQIGVQYATNSNYSNSSGVATKVNDGAYEYSPTTLYAWFGDRYTKAETNNLVNAKLPLSGGSMTGDIHLQNHSIDGIFYLLAWQASMWLETSGICQFANPSRTQNASIAVWDVHYSGSLAHDSYRGCKENIKDISSDDYRKILDIPIHKFDYRPGFGGDKKGVVGMIVDEVEKIIPEATVIPEDWDESSFNELRGKMGNENVPGIDDTVFIPYLIALVQDHEKDIHAKKKTIENLQMSQEKLSATVQEQSKTIQDQSNEILSLKQELKEIKDALAKLQ